MSKPNLTPAELATNSPEIIERVQGSSTMPTTTQALYRFHIGLVTTGGVVIYRSWRADARALIDATYPGGYTLTEVQGHYKGTDEPAWIVEVYAGDSPTEVEWARTLAVELRELLSQECIGLAILPVSSFTLI